MNKSNIQIVMASLTTICCGQTPHKKLSPQLPGSILLRVYLDPEDSLMCMWNLDNSHLSAQ